MSEDEIKKLERTISGYFDYLENIVENRVTMTMKDLANSVDKFIDFNEYKVLDNKGSISRAIADQKAKSEYDRYNKHQPIESDFDKEVKRLIDKKG